MLLSFEVGNFRSFGERQELSLFPSERESKFPEYLLQPPGVADLKALPLAVIYGPNSAGKSNLVKALRALKALVTERPTTQTPDERFRFSARLGQLPTELRVRFCARARVFEYEVARNHDAVERESLSVASKPALGGGLDRVFSRTSSGQVMFDERCADELPVGIGGLLDVVGVAANELVLGKLFDVLAEEKLRPLLAAVRHWFRSQLTIIGPEDRAVALPELLLGAPDLRTSLASFLRTAGTGMSDLDIRTWDLELESLEPTVRATLELLPVGQTISSGWVDMTRDTDRHFRALELQAVHRSGEAEVHSRFSDESDGTQRLLQLLPMIFAAGILREPPQRVFVVDELDRSLHATLVHAFVDQFVRRASKTKNQLITTTHETHLLDATRFRRDCFWFMNKTESGESRLYSLDEFPVRPDLPLDKAYLDGRFDAIPPVGGLDDIT